MSKLQTVQIKTRTDVYDQPVYSIVEAGTGYMIRSDIGNYEFARELAERFDAQNLDPEYAGWGGHELS